MNEKSVQVLSLFDGISCGRVALERAGFGVKQYHAFEIDKYAIQIAKKNYSDTLHYGDVLGNDYTEFRNIDILLAGSPCTFWSIAKKGRELDKDGMGWKLFERFLLALRTTDPKYFVYENVASMPKNIKDYITEELGVEPILINSSLVSAQQRKRLYWTNIPNVTQPKDRQIYLHDILEDNWFSEKLKSYCVDVIYNNAGGLKDYFEESQKQLIHKEKPYRLGEYGKGGQGERIYSIFGKSVTLSANGGGRGAKTGLYAVVDKNEIMDEIKKERIYVRKLTPLECERLQCLPDNYTEGISNTQRYKTIGNGWTIDVVSHILSFINT